jgi:hypothetical protein
VKFAVEVLSLFAFLLGSPIYLPRLAEAVPKSSPVPATIHSPAAQSAIPPAKQS